MKEKTRGEPNRIHAVGLWGAAAQWHSRGTSLVRAPLRKKDFGACQTSSAHLGGRAALVPLAFRLGAAAYHILRGEPQLGGSQ